MGHSVHKSEFKEEFIIMHAQTEIFPREEVLEIIIVFSRAGLWAYFYFMVAFCVNFMLNEFEFSDGWIGTPLTTSSLDKCINVFHCISVNIGME